MSTTLLKKSRDFKDVSFSMAMHPQTKNLLAKTNIEAVKQSVINLLTLKKGDKPFHPEIASPIYGYLFELAGAVERLVLEGEVKRYLQYYEPRLNLQSVVVSFSNVNAIECTIIGNIVNTLEPFTVNVLVNRLR